MTMILHQEISIIDLDLNEKALRGREQSKK